MSADRVYRQAAKPTPFKSTDILSTIVAAIKRGDYYDLRNVTGIHTVCVRVPHTEQLIDVHTGNIVSERLLEVRPVTDNDKPNVLGLDFFTNISKTMKAREQRDVLQALQTYFFEQNICFDATSFPVDVKYITPAILLEKLGQHLFACHVVRALVNAGGVAARPAVYTDAADMKQMPIYAVHTPEPTPAQSPAGGAGRAKQLVFDSPAAAVTPAPATPVAAVAAAPRKEQPAAASPGIFSGAFAFLRGTPAIPAPVFDTDDEDEGLEDDASDAEPEEREDVYFLTASGTSAHLIGGACKRFAQSRIMSARAQVEEGHKLCSKCCPQVQARAVPAPAAAQSPVARMPVRVAAQSPAAAIDPRAAAYIAPAVAVAEKLYAVPPSGTKFHAVGSRCDQTARTKGNDWPRMTHADVLSEGKTACGVCKPTA